MKEKFIFSYTEKLAVSFGNNTMILLSYHDLKKEKTRKEKFYDKFVAVSSWKQRKVVYNQFVRAENLRGKYRFCIKKDWQTKVCMIEYLLREAKNKVEYPLSP